jgi:hypothetical protein
MKGKVSHNSLGFGHSGKSYSLIPKNQGISYKVNTQNILKGYKKKKNVKTNFSSINDNFINEVNSLKKRSTNNNIPNEEYKPIEEDKPDFDIPTQYDNKINFNVDWNNVFTTVCKKKLFNTFRDLKMIINSIPGFHELFVCYIDETNARYIIQKEKNITTLRITINNLINKQISNVSETNLNNTLNLNRALELVKFLEFLAPSNNLVILLNEKQIRTLQSKFLSGKQLYWPNGNDGITWCTQL